MKFYAVNGSPRKKRNTATVLGKALEGITAACPEAQTEMLHLYDYNYKGCISCFECKRLGGKSYGRCAVRDELAPVLEKLSLADGIIFGSPIYFQGI
ncbi:flavodoxin family protein, partial [Desulfovibrio sp.]|uniref:flavodoxin family protein n=1 Tax=Desulfovibrio sp. TaxID=885 RepID=UPI0025BF9667